MASWVPIAQRRQYADDLITLLGNDAAVYYYDTLPAVEGDSKGTLLVRLSLADASIEWKTDQEPDRVYVSIVSQTISYAELGVNADAVYAELVVNVSTAPTIIRAGDVGLLGSGAFCTLKNTVLISSEIGVQPGLMEIDIPGAWGG